MPKFKFDEQEYDTDDLSDEQKAQLESLLFSEQQLRRLNMEAALTQTARNGYLKALGDSLKSVTPVKNKSGKSN